MSISAQPGADVADIPVVILAGGLGTRLREETEFRPKPMVEIGGLPIIWHIMKRFSTFGFREFIVSVGYKGDVIKDYFLNYSAHVHDFTVTLGESRRLTIHRDLDRVDDWTVTVANTGERTMTGGRVLGVSRFIAGRRFLVTYGDGLSDVHVPSLLDAHERQGGVATVMTVQPLSRFGVMDVADGGQVQQFREKPQLDGWVNAGLFVCEPDVLGYLDMDSIFEERPLTQMAKEGRLQAYRHHGFWQPMDTYREAQMLNALWDSGDAPWRNWHQ